MRKTGLVIIWLVAAFVACAEPRNSCSESHHCREGYCCTDGKCLKDLGLGCSHPCLSDLSCLNGCRIKFKCEPESSHKCDVEHRCPTNSDCDSSCCKNNQCQATIASCPVLNRVDKSKCSSSDDCFASKYGNCCVKGHCGVCTHDTQGNNNNFLLY